MSDTIAVIHAQARFAALTPAGKAAFLANQQALATAQAQAQAQTDADAAASGLPTSQSVPAGEVA
jgi:hypothetical protein